jgi:hypothetical protein
MPNLVKFRHALHKMPAPLFHTKMYYNKDERYCTTFDIFSGPSNTRIFPHECKLKHMAVLSSFTIPLIALYGYVL